MQRIVLVLPVCLLVLSGCVLWEGPTLSDVCQVDAVGDVFGSTGTFDTAEAAVGSVVDDPSTYRRVGSDAGRVLYGGPGDPPTQVVELERDENGWSVFAVNMCGDVPVGIRMRPGPATCCHRPARGGSGEVDGKPDGAAATADRQVVDIIGSIAVGV